MESSLFEDLVCFLQKEELVLKALRATDLKACLRTGTGTKGYEANAERAKYYRIYNKIEKQVTPDQKATLMDWERRLCSEAEDIDFARLLAIFASREEELKQMRKPSLEACFNSNLSKTDKNLKFCQNFFKRKKTSMADEQQKVVDEWEEKIRGDGAGLCPAIDADFARLLTILENRQDDLRQIRNAKKQVWQMNSKRLWMNGRRRFVAMVRGYVLPSMQISHACLLYWKTVKMTCDKSEKQVSKHVSTAA